MASSNSNFRRVNVAYLDGFHYLEMPLQIHYHFNQKWSIFTGVKVSYLINTTLNIPQKDSTLLLYLNRNNTSSTPIANISNGNRISVLESTNINNSALGLNDFDFGILGGISYNWNRHVSTQLRYDFGLKNIYLESNPKVYNRFLSLNILYKF
jgi:hypothetical protein